MMSLLMTLEWSISNASRSINDDSRSISNASRSINDASRSINDASRSINDASRSINDASRSINDASRSINYVSRSILDDSRVTAQIVASLVTHDRHLQSSLTLIIYNRNMFIVQATGAFVPGKYFQASLIFVGNDKVQYYKTFYYHY